MGDECSACHHDISIHKEHGCQVCFCGVIASPRRTFHDPANNLLAEKCDAIDALKAELAKVKEERHEYRSNWKFAEGQLDARRAEVERLRATFVAIQETSRESRVFDLCRNALSLPEAARGECRHDPALIAPAEPTISAATARLAVEALEQGLRYYEAGAAILDLSDLAEPARRAIVAIRRELGE